MGEVVRGQIADRPWGLTFGQFGLRAVSGQLTVRGADTREYRVAFSHGQIVGATSPLAADAATRIALTTGLISSSQAPTVAKQIAATPEGDEIALLASACRLDDTKVALLRKRVLVQRAARTFSVEEGTFLLEDEIAIPVSSDADVDIRAVIYHGARMNLTETRLATELRDLGSHFTLGKTALVSAEQFGLDALEWPIIDALRERTTLPELEARHRELDPRNVQSVIYALIACRECTVETVEQTEFAAPRTTSKEPISVSFKPTRDGLQRPATGTVELDPKPRGTMPRAPSAPISDSPSDRVSFRGSATGSQTVPRLAGTGSQNAMPRASATGSQNAVPPVRPATPTVPPATRTAAPSVLPPTTRVPTTTQPRTTTPTATPRTMTPTAGPTPRTTTPSAAPPTRSKPLSPAPPPVIARTTSASGSLLAMPRTVSQNDFEYSEGSDRVRQALTKGVESFKLGQAALRENEIQLALVHLSNASTLNPHEFDHSAVLAFAQFLNATPAERTKSADKVRKMLNHMTQKSVDSEQARFYLAQMEELLGNKKEALKHYQTILKAMPNQPEAMAAIQAIEEKAAEKTGFSLFRKKT